MKVLFDSLDALLAELRERPVKVVRVSPALAIEASTLTARVPQLVVRVLVTAALDEHTWAEWRQWVGQALVDLSHREFEVPMGLREQRDRVLADIAKRIDDAGFLVREGILTDDQGVMDTFTP